MSKFPFFFTSHSSLRLTLHGIRESKQFMGLTNPIKAKKKSVNHDDLQFFVIFSCCHNNSDDNTNDWFYTILYNVNL